MNELLHGFLAAAFVVIQFLPIFKRLCFSGDCIVRLKEENSDKCVNLNNLKKKKTKLHKYSGILGTQISWLSK